MELEKEMKGRRFMEPLLAMERIRKWGSGACSRIGGRAGIFHEP